MSQDARVRVPSGSLPLRSAVIHRGAGAASRTSKILQEITPSGLLEDVAEQPQKAIPAIAKNLAACSEIEAACALVPTSHSLVNGDARDLSWIPDESIQLVVTSPPYWTLKEYDPGPSQLGHVDDYEEFNDHLSKVWSECMRVLVPGGRLVINVGDVCLPRRRFGRHVVVPLHATIQERCRAIGFDNLATIVWHKIANANFEAGGGGFLGKPYEPNAVIKNDIEWVLSQRKPGGYRSPTPAERVLSVIPRDRHREWFQQVWSMGGASTQRHPAPFPVVFAERLVRMFSFVGDTVMDPFSGTATTSIAALAWGRDSIGVESQAAYHAEAVHRVTAAVESSAANAQLRLA
ncbi:MAG: methyltransferase [Acidobacteria bacterium]|nr:MAG: methyltransferase [Acidobacteriota bacterium]